MDKITIPAGWHRIHDFLLGFGYRYYDGVNDDGTDKIVYVRDAERFLNVIIERESDVDFDDLWARIEPLKQAWLEERRKQPATKITHISIPKVNRVYPQL